MFVHVKQDNSAVVICPQCRIQKTVNAGKGATRGRRSNLKCKKCGHSFSVYFEFRENTRRYHYVAGYYRPIEENYDRSAARSVNTSGGLVRMRVQNISRTGIGFIVPKGHRLKVGDRIEVMFRLDDEKETRIKRIAVVRRLAEGNYLGCEFMDFGHVDQATGFYVMT